MKKTHISKSIIITSIGVILGATVGLLYWKFVGCNTGHCPIQSVWYNSTGYGALMGGLIVNTFSTKK